MRNFITSFRYAIAVFVVVVLAALAWWYFMLSAQTHEIALEDASRGSSSETPSFKSRVGSTYENIVTSASSFQREGGSAPETLGRLAQISTTPTAGAGFVAEGTSTSVRFVERSTGYVLEASVADGSLTRLTNTLLPRTYKAIVGEESILMQTLEESGVITTVVGVVSAASSSETSVFISTKRLPDGIRTVTESEDEAVARAIKAHVASMEKRLYEGRVFNLFSPTLPVLFDNKDKIKTVVEMTGKGSIVTQTSGDAVVVAALQAHAVEVSELARDGMAAMMRNMRANMMGSAAPR